MNVPSRFIESVKVGLAYALVTAGIIALALVSIQLPTQAEHSSIVWLPSGLALALLILRGRRMVLPTLAALFVASLVHVSQTSNGNGSLNTFLAIYLSYAAAPLVAYWVFWQTSRSRHPLTDYLGFIWLLGAITVASLASALPMTYLAAQTAVQGSTPINEVLLLTWFSHALGCLTVTPLILSLVREPMVARLFYRPLEWLLWATGLAFIVGITLYDVMQSLFLLLPLMTWAATRFSLSGSMLAISMATFTALACVFLLVDPELAKGLDALLGETLIVAIAGTTCYVRVLLADRERVENSLETTVEERTRELQLTNFELKDEIFIREQAEKSFRRSSRHFRALFENTSNPIIVVERDGSIRQWNSAAETLFGYSRDDAMDRNLLQAFIPPEQRDELAWKITKVLTTGLPRDQIETRVNSFDGTSHTILWNINRLQEEDEEAPVQIILIGQDISEIRETQNQLHYLAHYDVLTDTANRRLFEDRCRQAIASALRHGHYCALIALDVDHFKRINDTLGHDAGDELLQELARRLQKNVREEDTIARLGGDEFAILLTQVNGADGCEKVARGILNAITEPVRIPSGELIITSSIGITLAPLDGKTYDDLLKNADMAMYRAKKAGRNNIQFFSHDMNEEMQRQMTLERELRGAIREGQLDLYYQPIISVRSGRIVGLEALLRWHHPTRGLLSPTDFLDVAEQTGQLQQLGEWVCHNACLQSRAIQAMSPTPVPVSINLSSRQYNHPQLATSLQRIIKDTNLDPSLLTLEIDERVLGDRLDETATTLGRLKKLGIGLALDRFGSGLSSLRLLRDLPFDQVKIDQNLIQQAPNEENTAAIVHTLINLARQLSLTVAASGVENVEEDTFVRSAGCHLMQGHRFCPPLPSSGLGTLFDEVRKGRQLLPEDQYSLPLRHDNPQDRND
ncbi:bifunctional diguanylate cyclase/phosphodiesterase [Marinobacter fonticola]|uniref:bifunctional diguanylate cyclase/phosphodiesterase n=1 Tax=Marinobacter fonticola TaxID=2603215 RepID=UPI0011E6FD84|nr:EAL domain-containing protein [Marinobacter fonticola]